MGGLLGSGSRTTADIIAGIQIQTSCYGGALPLVYGTTRLAGNLVDYDDFTSHASTTSQGKGGGGSSSTTYTYTAGGILALCEGAVSAINRVWRDKDVNTMAYWGLSLITGTRPQTPWATWTSKHPLKALAYAGMALVCNASFDLGTSGAMKNHSFETTALLATELDTGSLITLGLGDGTRTQFQLFDYSGNPITDMSGLVSPTYYANGTSLSSGFSLSKISGNYYLILTTAPASGVAIGWSMSLLMLDAKPSAVVVDFLSDPYHGALWNPARISDLVTGGASYQTYCTAMGFAISPSFDTQKLAADHLQDILTATNAEAVWTAGSTGMFLKIVPYGDTTVIGNGVTYTPNVTPLYALGYDDFLGVIDAQGNPTGNDPVTFTRTDPADVFNTIPVEFLDRMNAYNTGSVSDPEPVDVAQNGTKTGNGVTLHMICRRAMAKAISRIQAQKSVYVRNTYTFTIGWKYILLEPMDLVTLTDAKLGLNNLVVRIVSIDFPDDASEDQGMVVTAEGWPFGTGATVPSPFQNNGSTVVNTSAVPGNANAPVIFDVPPQFSQSGGPEVVIATAGGQNWGGCLVFASADGSTYQQIGTINKPCRYGVLTSAMAASGGAAVAFTISSGSLTSVASSVATDLQSMMWVNGELVAFSTATLTGGFAYTLTLPVRGAYGTTAAIHANGSSIIRLDDAVFRYPVPPSRLGTVMHIKLVSFNLWGGGVQDISTVTDYTYTPTSQGTYPNQPGQNPSQTTIAILSGDYLTNADKISLMTSWDQELATQITLNAQAAVNSVSTAPYAAALATLSGGLIAAGAPSNWASVWPDNLTLHSVGICTALAGWWASIATQRAALQGSIANAAALAVQAIAQAQAATNVINKLNVVGLKNPTPAAWAYSARPALPNGTYPAGSCWKTTDGHEVQVNADGTLWNDVVVSATAIVDQLVASQLTISNTNNLCVNPQSELPVPWGGWPAGSIEGAGVQFDAAVYNGTHDIGANGPGSDILIPKSALVPCAPGDIFSFYGQGRNYSVGAGGTGYLVIHWFDSYGTELAGSAGYSIVASWAPVNNSMAWTLGGGQAQAPAGASFARFDCEAINLLAGNNMAWDALDARRCNDGSVTVDGYFTSTTAGIAQNIRSTNYSATYLGNAATGFKLSAVGMPGAVDILGNPHSDVLLDLGGAMLIGGYYAGQMAFAKLYYQSSGATGAGGNYQCTTPGAWSWTAPKIGPAGTQYQIKVTLAAGGAGGGGNGLATGGGAGGVVSIIMTVRDGMVLSGVIGAGGSGGSTTASVPGGASTLVLSSTNNVSGFTPGTLFNCASGDTAGNGGQVTGIALGNAGLTNNNSVAIIGINLFLNGGAGGGAAAHNGGANDNATGWLGGNNNTGAGGGGASAFGPGGNGLNGGGQSPPSFAYGAGGGASNTVAGAAGMGGTVIIQII